MSPPESIADVLDRHLPLPAAAAGIGDEECERLGRASAAETERMVDAI